jgi:hypothetical protein
MRLSRPALLLLLVGAATLTACGGAASRPTSTASASIGLPPGHQGVQTIKAWVDTLRRGDVARAADYFALPSVTQNGTPPVVLRTHADAVAFNSSLPCGATLVRALPAGRLIAATFRLTERPGGSCGAGVGLLARTAFLIRAGKIVLWRRLPNPPGGSSAPSGPIV